MVNVWSSCVDGCCCALRWAVSRWVLLRLYCIKKKKEKKISYFPPFNFFLFLSHWFIWSLSLKFQLAFPREPGPNTLNFRGDGNSEFCSSALNRTSMQALDSKRETERIITLQHNTSEGSRSQCLKAQCRRFMITYMEKGDVINIDAGVYHNVVTLLCFH